jgi:uncharacterized protein (TIGR03437 family)
MKTLTGFIFAGALFGQSAAPTIAPNGLTYEDVNTLNPNALSYQMTDYDQGHNQVLFYPYGNVTATPFSNSGELLVYKPVPGGFNNPANWEEIDLTSVVAPFAWNFGGGFMDGSGPSTSLPNTNPTYAYLPVGPRNNIPGMPSKATQGSITVQVNLANLASDPLNVNGQTYKYINLNTVRSIPEIGGFAGIWGNGAAYFCPTGSNLNFVANTVLIRYNSAIGAYDDPTAWESFDMSTIPVLQGTGPADPQLGGMQSAAYVAPNIYMVPFFNGNETSSSTVTMSSKLVVYNTTGSFTSGSSYQTFDLSTLSSMNPTLFAGSISNQFRGYTGAVVVNGGKNLILVPWGDRSLQINNSVALEYNTTMALNDPAAWSYFNLETLSQKAAGFQFGWLDKDGYVWFVPTHDYQASTAPGIPPFMVYNTALPFNEATSWVAYTNNGYPSGKEVWLTGAAYDANTNTAWMSSYGSPPTSNPNEPPYNLELQEQGVATSSIAAGGIVNAATYKAPVAPGSIASAFGSLQLGFAYGATSVPLATDLSGLSLSFGGTAAPMLFVAPNQANFQVPWELAGQSTATVTTSLIGENGSSQSVALATYAPGIFTAASSGTGQGEIYSLGYVLANSSAPASAGDFVVIYCTGLGPVTNQPATGAPGPSSPLASTSVATSVSIGGVPVTNVQFAGLAPGFVGLYQVNAQIPAGVAAGSAVPVVVSINGAASNTVTMAIQ